MIHKRIRFSNTSASLVQFNVNRQGILNLLAMAVSSTELVRLANAVRVKSIEVWNLSASGSSSANVNAVGEISVQWESQYSPSMIVSDSGTVFRPAHIRTKPPKDSLASYWSLSGSNESETLFKMVLPQQCIFDVIFDFVLQNNYLNSDAPVGITPSVTSPILGTVYLCALDGVGSTGSLFAKDYPVAS